MNNGETPNPALPGGGSMDRNHYSGMTAAQMSDIPARGHPLTPLGRSSRTGEMMKSLHIHFIYQYVPHRQDHHLP